MTNRARPMVRRMSEADEQFVPYKRPPSGAPNVVVIVLDDVGFAQLGAFGSPIATPNIDRLAMNGLRYDRFHVTSICSSTRAALLSGRNHHAVGMGMTMETPMGFPGYTGRIPKSAALLPRILRDNGYSTMAVGKWHLCPRGEYSASGPMDRWPVAQGFEHYYGFLSAETSQWDPPLCQDNTFVDPPRTPAEGYHLTEDLADRAISMVLDQQQATPHKPFFTYFAPGAAHAPHQVPEEWSEAYRGRFDQGWEAVRSAIFERQVAEGIVPAATVLTERPPWVQDWGSLSADERRLFARYMEVFAGFVTHADAQIGRFIQFLTERGVMDNTLVLVLSDNGASAEGSPVGTINEPNAWVGQVEGVDAALGHLDELGGHRAFNHYPWGWAWAGNTPLQLWKRYAWLGGVRTPLVAHWPGHMDGPGAVRPQFCHAVDVFSTVLDAAKIEPPAVVDGVTQQPIDGISFIGTMEDRSSPSPRQTQYFEMHGSRAIYHDGWKATTDYVSPLFGERSLLPGSHDIDEDHWALFNLERGLLRVPRPGRRGAGQGPGAPGAVVGRSRPQPGAPPMGGWPVRSGNPSRGVPAAGSRHLFPRWWRDLRGAVAVDDGRLHGDGGARRAGRRRVGRRDLRPRRPERRLGLLPAGWAPGHLPPLLRPCHPNRRGRPGTGRVARRLGAIPARGRRTAQPVPAGRRRRGGVGRAPGPGALRGSVHGRRPHAGGPGSRAALQ